jgi:hypothetical protein
MKVLLVIARNPYYSLLVRLHTKELIQEIKRLIDRKRHSQAIVKALVKGRFEKKVEDYEMPFLKTDLILSKDSASWDLTPKISQ